MASNVRRVGEASHVAAGTGSRRAFDFSPALWSIAVLALGAMVVVPLAHLIAVSFRDPLTGGATLANYVAAFGDPIYLRPILNSLELAGGVACIAVAVGTPLAWLVSRTDLPLRGAIRALVIAAFVTPEFLGAEAWIFLAAPTSGWLNRGVNAFTHGTGPGPFNAYTMPFAIFVVALYTIPYAFTFVSGTLDMLPSDMEDAAASLGANPVRTALSVTLPLAAPAIVAAFLMSFLESLGLFGAPAILLIPARQQTITTQIFAFFQFPQRVELAAAYAIPLLAITLALLAAQRRILGRKTFTIVGGKGGRARRYPLGRWRAPALLFALAPSALAIALPYAALLGTSLSKSWGNGIVVSNFTLHWYRWALFENPDARTAIAHSLSYGAVASAIALVVAASVAYAAARRIVPGASLLAIVCTIPVVVPGIVLALGLFAAYSRPPVVLYGTSAMLVLAFATRFLPAAFSNVTSLVRGVHPELEHAARTLGATRLRVVGSITLPILRRGLFATWLLVFVPMLRELSAAVFLATPKTAVVTTMMYSYTDEGNFEPVATLGIVMMAITLAIVLAVNRLGGGGGRLAGEVR